MPERPQHSSPGYAYVMSIITILVVYQILYAGRVLIDNRVMLQGLPLDAIIRSGIALLWVILFSHAALQLWRKHEGIIRYSHYLIIAFVLSSLLQTALFVQADYNRNRIAFQVMVTLLISIVPILLLLRQSRAGTHK